MRKLADSEKSVYCVYNNADSVTTTIQPYVGQAIKLGTETVKRNETEQERGQSSKFHRKSQVSTSGGTEHKTHVIKYMYDSVEI